MSPRRRGHGRHGGGNGAGGPGSAAGAPGGAAGAVGPEGQGSVAEFGAADAAGSGADGFGALGAAAADPVERPAAERASVPWNGIARVNGYRPNGASGGGGAFGGGQPGGQRRQPRGRPSGRVSSPMPAPDSTPVPVPESGTDVAALAVDEDVSPVPGRHSNCTLAQMRRFIKSRPYVPVHELRRRFEIEGIEDEVSPVATERGTIYVGLPPEQARFLGDLIRSGDIGCEMLLDPESPGVIGVFPMRPVARQ